MLSAYKQYILREKARFYANFSTVLDPMYVRDLKYLGKWSFMTSEVPIVLLFTFTFGDFSLFELEFDEVALKAGPGRFCNIISWCF